MKTKKILERAEEGKSLSLVDAIRFLVDGYMDNCGISTAIRTVYYDVGANLFDLFKKTNHPLAKELGNDPCYCTVMGKFNKAYAENASEYDEYDIIPLDYNDYISICENEIEDNTNRQQVDALCYGVSLINEF